VALRKWMPAIVAAVVYLLVDADRAYAWGSAAHAQFAADVLNTLPALPAAVAAILARYAGSFVFGNVAADVVFAKRMSKIKQSCHHWSTAFHLLDQSAGDRDRAFAFGYLAHLAADTIAHNKYVPRQLGLTRTTLGFGHLYWEIRADALMPDEAWRILEDVFAQDHEHHHRVLARELSETLLPYRLNRRLFNGLNDMLVRRHWMMCVAALQEHSRWEVPASLMAGYRAEAVEQIVRVLSELHGSAVLRADPNGTAALHQARLHRRDLRRLRRRGMPVDRRRLETAAALAPQTAARHRRPGSA
jgi:hypothetical protein